MPSIEQHLAPVATVLATDNSAGGGALSIDRAVGARTRVFVTAIVISASAAPAAPVAATLTIDGQTVTFQLPAAAYAPIFINFARAPLEGNFGETVTLAVPSHGGGVVISGSIFGYTASS